MKITDNFSKNEFDSKDGAEMPNDVYLNIVELAKQLQFLRDYTNRPIKINSGYRSPQHNKNIGGSKKSQHVLGKAADIVIKNYDSLMTYNLIEDLINEGKMLEGGLGLYDTFVHYDIRGSKARCNYSTKY